MRGKAKVEKAQGSCICDIHAENGKLMLSVA